MARPLRRGAGRGAAGLHGQPALRPAPRPAGPGQLARPRQDAGQGRAARSRRGGVDPRRARPRRGGAGGGPLRVRPRGRGHPHRHRAPGHGAGRARRGPSCTPGGPATTRSPPTCASTPRRSWARSPGGSARCSNCCSSAPARRARPICPATPTCSERSRCCSPITSWPTDGRWPATWSDCSTAGAVSTCHRSAPGRWPAPRCRSIRASPCRSWASPGSSTTPSTRCPTATSWPSRCSAWRCWPCTSPAWPKS